MSFSISNLPQVNGKTVRVFQLKPVSQLKLLTQIKLREWPKLSLSQAAEKMGIEIERLVLLGISEKGIDLSKLRNALIDNIPNEIRLRNGEDRTIDNVIAAIAGRLGDEKFIFEPFNIERVLRRKSLSYNEKTLLMIAYVEQTDVLHLPSQGKIVLGEARKLYSIDVPAQQKFIVDVGKGLHLKYPRNLALFLIGAAEMMYPGNNSSQWEFVNKIGCELYSRESLIEFQNASAEALGIDTIFAREF